MVAPAGRGSIASIARAPARVWPLLLVLVACSTALRLVAALAIPSPWITPDEETYALLGRSLYHSGRFEILGHGVDFLSLVYPAVIGVPLSISGPHAGYVGAKVVQALLASLVAVPVYLWGRRLMGRWQALVAAALALTLPGLAYAGFLMTEIVFTVLVVVSAWASARALETPTLDAQALAVGTMLLAVLTRFQAIALAPAFVLALALQLAFERGSPRRLSVYLPSLAGLVVIASGWVVFQRTSGTGGGVLGSYSLAGHVSYDPGAVTRFVVYHLADLAILTAVFPCVALVILAVQAFAGREESARARAFLAVTVSYLVCLVLEVGLFTSRLTGRVGERYLLPLAPLLLLCFCLWLDRGAPRPRLPTALAAAAVLALVATFPFRRFVVEAAAPDSFSLIPLYRLRQHLLGSHLALAASLAAACLLVLLVFARGRAIWLLPAVAVALLTAASVSASRFLASQGRGYAAVMVGPDKEWIDARATSPVGFLYAGELAWSGGGPVWVNLFWNRRIDGVYSLGGGPIYGPVPRTRVRVAPSGTIEDARGAALPERYVVASSAFTLAGEELLRSGVLALWRVEPPARVSTRVTGMRLQTGDVDSLATITAYGCSGGAFVVDIAVPEPRTLELFRDGQRVRTLHLAAGERWRGRLPAAGRGACRLRLVSFRGGFHVNDLDFARPAAGS